MFYVIETNGEINLITQSENIAKLFMCYSMDITPETYLHTFQRESLEEMQDELFHIQEETFVDDNLYDIDMPESYAYVSESNILGVVEPTLYAYLVLEREGTHYQFNESAVNALWGKQLLPEEDSILCSDILQEATPDVRERHAYWIISEFRDFSGVMEDVELIISLEVDTTLTSNDFLSLIHLLDNYWHLGLTGEEYRKIILANK